MKQITLKTILLIDGREFILESCDLSESISEYEIEQDVSLLDDEIIDYIIDP